MAVDFLNQRAIIFFRRRFVCFLVISLQPYYLFGTNIILRILILFRFYCQPAWKQARARIVSARKASWKHNLSDRERKDKKEKQRPGWRGGRHRSAEKGFIRSTSCPIIQLVKIRISQGLDWANLIVWKKHYCPKEGRPTYRWTGWRQLKGP